MEEKKIIIVTRNMNGGGAERVIAQLANWLVQNHRKCLIITVDECRNSYPLDKKVSLRSIGKQSGNTFCNKITQYRKVRQIVTKERPYCVLSMPEEIGIYVILCLLGLKTRVYVSERNNPWVMPDKKVTRVLRRLMYPFARGIIFQTEMAKSFFSKSIQRKSIILDNPIDINRIPEQFIGIREKRVVAVGRLEKQKNFKLLINAFSKFSELHDDYILEIYGEGSLRDDLESQINSLSLSEKVVLKGRDSEVLPHINSAAMFILSSDYEGMPNVLLEAMCMGMPVISTDCPSGGPRHVIKDKDNGILVHVGNEDELCHAMEILSDNKVSKQLSDRAYELRERLTDEKIYQNWDNYLFK